MLLNCDEHPVRDQILVLLPTLNELANLPSLLDSMFRAVPECDVVVIDDDSSDGTGEYAQKRAAFQDGLKVINRYASRGFGSAIRQGLDYAIKENYGYLLCLDADFSHDPADLPRLLEAAKKSDPPADVVIGSRYVAGGRTVGWPLLRKGMSWLVNLFAMLILRLPVRDCSGGIRCYRVEALRKLDLASLRSDGYSIQEELLLRLREKGAVMKEIPITFVERKRGQSKLTLREALRSAWQLMRMATQR